MDESDKKFIEESLKPKNDLPEAPLSINIGSYYKGFYVGWTRRSADNKVSTYVGEVKQFIDKLVENGYLPSWNAQTNDTALGKQTTATPPPTAPGKAVEVDTVPVNATCSVHGTPLEWKTGVSNKTNKPYAFWACSQKLPDGTFCKAGGNK